MGMKGIHVVLIGLAVLLGTAFGGWSLFHGHTVMGCISIVLTAAAAVYGIDFIKKFKTL